ncbi:hypothetical protein KKE34_02920 [Patescibacteria group bacterium]|nr:hypothetical protein [Patescibacteria group bacterium]MBU1885541.1 hypothetical protein [Patescibacteria group bacterium]
MQESDGLSAAAVRNLEELRGVLEDDSSRDSAKIVSDRAIELFNTGVYEDMDSALRAALDEQEA